MSKQRSQTRKHNRFQGSMMPLEMLEDRRLMATWGIPWADPQHLTLSFAPDGTKVAGQQSQLFQELDSEIGAGVWEKAILQGVQTWSSNANINVGVVADGGQPIGSPGPAQGDPRFGDIRVTAAPLAPGVLATSSPYDPSLGTFSGDLILNSSYDWNPNDAGSYDLLTVALHEAGHLFGFADSSDPANFMYNVYTGPKTGISPAAVSALQGLYGPSTVIGNVGDGGIGNPTQLPNMGNGSVPITLAGRLANSGTAHYYSVQAPSNLPLGSVDISVRTAGISFLTPILTVLDQSGKVVATSAASGPLDGGTTIHLISPTPGAHYSIEVSSPSGSVFGVGAYSLVVTPNLAAGASNVLGNATPINPPGGYTGTSPLTAFGSIGAQVNTHTFSFKTLSTNLNGVTVQLQQWGVGLTAPQLRVYDANQVLVASTTTMDPTNQTLTLHLDSVLPNATYFVQAVNGLMPGLNIGVFEVQIGFNSTVQASPNATSAIFAAMHQAPNPTINQATQLQTPNGYANNSRYIALGSVSTTSPQVFYKLTPPPTPTGQTQYMTVTIQSLKVGGNDFWGRIFDDKGNPVSATCLGSEGGVGVFKIPVNPSINTYYVEVAGSRAGGSPTTGDFSLGVQFALVGASLDNLASGTVPTTPDAASLAPQTVDFTSDQSRYYRFVFGSNGGSGSSLQATIFDMSGNALGSAVIAPNESSSFTVFLDPGTYSIRLTPINQPGSSTSPLSWIINDESLSEPILPYTYKASGSSTSTLPK